MQKIYFSAIEICCLHQSHFVKWNSFFSFLIAGKDIAPKTVNDLKLINGGRILENNRTLAESHVPVGEVPGSVITMHVVVRPPQADKNSGIADNFSLFPVDFIVPLMNDLEFYLHLLNLAELLIYEASFLISTCGSMHYQDH